MFPRRLPDATDETATTSMKGRFFFFFFISILALPRSSIPDAKFGKPPETSQLGAKTSNSTEIGANTHGLSQQTTLKNNNVTREHTSYEYQQKRTDRQNQNNGDQHTRRTRLSRGEGKIQTSKKPTK